MPQFQLQRGRSRRTGVSRAPSRRRRQRASRTSCCSTATRRSRSASASRSPRSRSPRSASPARTSCTSPGSWPRSSAPASPSTRPSASSATVSTTSGSKGILLEIEEDLQAGAPFATAVARHAERLPALLRQHPPLGRAHRPARRGARPALRATSSATWRPAPRSRRPSPTRPSSWSCPSSPCWSWCSSSCPGSSTSSTSSDSELPLPTRMLLGFAGFIGTWWWARCCSSWSLVVLAYVLIGPIRAAAATPGSRLFLPDPARRHDHRVLRHRALLPGDRRP